MWMVIGAILIIAMACSTSDQRAAARKRLRLWSPWLWGATAAIWLLIFLTPPG